MQYKDIMNKNNNRDLRILYLILSYIVWGIFWGAWGVLLPSIKKMIGATDASLGFALIGITMGAFPAMLGTGFIIKKFTKWVLFYVLIFFSISIAAITLVNSPLTLALVLFFVGGSSGMLDVVMNSGVATLESLTDKSYFNYAHSAFPLAVIVTSPTVGFARQIGINTKVILLVLSGIIALIALLNLKLDIKNIIKDPQKEEKKDKVRILFKKIIIFLGIIGLIVHLLESAVEQWSTIYLEQKLLASPTTASLGLTGYMAMLFVGRLIAQKVSSLWSNKRILTIFSIISVFGFLIVSVSINPIFVVIGYGLAGMGIAPIIPIIFSITGNRVVPKKRVKAISTITIIAYTGYLISPPFIGYISEIFTLRVVWFILTGISVLLVMIIQMITNQKSIESKRS